MLWLGGYMGRGGCCDDPARQSYATRLSVCALTMPLRVRNPGTRSPSPSSSSRRTTRLPPRRRQRRHGASRSSGWSWRSGRACVLHARLERRLVQHLLCVPRPCTCSPAFAAWALAPCVSALSTRIATLVKDSSKTQWQTLSLARGGAMRCGSRMSVEPASRWLVTRGHARRPAAHCTPHPRQAAAAPCPCRTSPGVRTQTR